MLVSSRMKLKLKIQNKLRLFKGSENQTFVSIINKINLNKEIKDKTLQGNFDYHTFIITLTLS